MVTAADVFVLTYYWRRANFDPNALAFIFLLWLAFFVTFLASIMILASEDDLTKGTKIANYTLYIVTRAAFWGLLYIYLFKLHEIYTVQRYG